jgi:hypothetical protein
MNGILGFARLLENSDLTGERQHEYINIINQSGARMLNIINDIIDISRIESGNVEVLNVETNINKQIEYLFNFFSPEAIEKGLDINFKSFLPDQKAIVSTDQQKLMEILTNLIKNAIKFTDKGSINFGYELKSENEQVELEFFVKDTGIGILQNGQVAIFDRFVQADISDARAFQGAGLGLAISKAYVEMLGGKIWLESEPENIEMVKPGHSNFYFTIPYIPVNEIKKEEKQTSVNIPDKFENIKILIVEDDDVSAQYLSDIICENCKEILFAVNGREAIDICKKHSDIDIILMDIKLPDLNGYDATLQIRKFNKDVIIIAQTALGLVGDREKSMEAGCDDYISKPVNQEVLVELIELHLKKKSKKPACRTVT